MDAPLGSKRLAACAFLACLQNVYALTRPSLGRDAVTHQNTHATMGMGNLMHHSHGDTAWKISASASQRNNRSNARSDALSLANRDGVRLHGLDTTLSIRSASSHFRPFDERQQAYQVLNSKSSKLGKLIFRSPVIPSRTMRHERKKAIQAVSPDGSVTTQPDTLQMQTEITQSMDSHPVAQVLAHGQARAFARNENNYGAQAGILESKAVDSHGNFIAHLSHQVPPTSVQGSAPGVAAPAPVAASPTATTNTSASQQGSTWFASFACIFFFVVILSVVALGSYWLGHRRALRESPEVYRQPRAPLVMDRSPWSNAPELSRLSVMRVPTGGYRARAASRGRGSDDDEGDWPASPSERRRTTRAGSPAAFLKDKLRSFEVGDRVKVVKETRLKGKTATVLDPRWKQPNGKTMVQVIMHEKDEKGEVKSFTETDLEHINIYEAGDRVKVTKETRLKGKTATVIDPCWRKYNGSTLVQVRMDEKDEKGEVKSFKEADLEGLNTFEVGDRVRVMKETRLKGKTATVLDPCWRKCNGYTLVQVKMDEADEKGEVKSFTQGDLEPLDAAKAGPRRQRSAYSSSEA
mmetsp:Transcript_17728/g.28831  ORF Transcript_17728/g.28831 Transcript_17728/m.28831 type:complete len:579 (-) Transcript_17728:79-1815(-)